MGGRYKSCITSEEAYVLACYQYIELNPVGPFLRIEVEITEGSYSGVKADVPACVAYHPSLKWITSYTLEPNNLTFNDDLVDVCD